MQPLKIQWFPGHMTKAKRMMESQLKLVDIVIEMLDARIPRSSSNPLLIPLVGGKPKIVVLNKIDLADQALADEYAERLRSHGLPTVLLDSTDQNNYKKLLSVIKEVAKPLLQKWLNKGVKNKSIRVMIVGIPNVGKSSLINRMIGKAKVKTGDKPGVTRGQQWLSIGQNIELLDTPGILWPKFEDPDIAFGLAVTGAIKDDIFDNEIAVQLLLHKLQQHYPKELTARYNIDISTLTADELINEIAKKRGCLKTGGVIDRDKAIGLILREYRDGKIGRFVLDDL